MTTPRPVQFLRDEAYSISPRVREGARVRWSVDAVVAEAMRDPDRPDALKRVKGCVRTPIQITEQSPADVATEAALTAATATERNGWKLRPSARVVLSRVMSYPRRCDDFRMSRDQLEAVVRAGLRGEPVGDHGARDLVDWIHASAAWSQRNLGVAGAIVIHLDEECPHAHHLVPIRKHPGSNVADLSFSAPEAAMIAARRAARDAGRKHTTHEVQKAYAVAQREVADEYYVEVGAAFGQARMTDQPRKRRDYRTQRALTEADRREAVAAAETTAKTESERAQKTERERDEQRTRAERAEAEVRSLTDRLAAADAENSRLRDKLRAVLDRARTWFGALRGDPLSLRDATEAPTISQAKIDGVLGVSRSDLERRRVSAL